EQHIVVIVLAIYLGLEGAAFRGIEPVHLQVNAVAALPALGNEQYRLAYNASMDLLKKKRGTVSLTAEDEEGEERELTIADTAPTPEESLEREETRRAVREAVARLPEDKREIIVMREFSGMSYSDIADALGIEEGTVKSRISRARAALAEILSEYGTFARPSPSKETKGGKKHA
ncbi:MAG: sigma-70 family RNA polymerase sigma factor, partial [Oscillospiraceae bacterium]|nr:sigma-70 family RNA polymerase sigma factor [Oscillospiraceae bacterium]